MKPSLAITALLLVTISLQPQAQSRAFNQKIKNTITGTIPTVSVKKIPPKNNLVFLDARQKEEYNVSHIQNATWVGYRGFRLKYLNNIPKDAAIIVYCSIGYRSEKIGEKLREAGYSDVRNLYGGIFEWVNQGRPVYQKGQRTNKVHGYSRRWGKWLQKGEVVYE